MSVAAGDDAAAVGLLPLAALRLPPETITSLQRLGLRTIAELEQLPRAGLATRLGERLLERWDQALGRKSEPIVTLAPLADWSLEQTLEIPTEHRETMLELVRRMSHTLSGRLARRGEGALRLVCRLDLVKRPSIVMQLGLFRPTNDAAHLEMLLAGQLEQQLRSVRTAPLWRISLQATLTAPMVWRQVDLFSGGEVVNRHEIARLVDTLSCRLGRKNVLSAKTRRESQPELASSFQPMTGRRPDGTDQETVRKLSSRLAKGEAQPSRDEPLRRPTQLLNPAVAIEVAGAWNPHPTAASPPLLTPAVSTDHPQELPSRSLATAPAQIRYQQVCHQVLEAAGPERLESGWWKGPSVRRDYYRVATDKGCWWWIYRDLNDGRWYLHGLFD
jgi:protein ImuB